MNVKGIQRRCFRALLRAEERRGPVSETPGETPLWGYGFRVAYPNRRIWLHQFLEIFNEDVYGTRRLPARPKVIDAGANVGMFSLHVLWRRPLARVTAVEPGATNLMYLERNLDVPGRAIEIRPVALSGQTGTARLVGDTSDSLRLVQSEGGGKTVRTAVLSELLVAPVDLLKIDVEGSELDVLRGAGDRLQIVERVVLEAHDYRTRQADLPEILRLLQRSGFSRFRIYGNREYAWDNPDLPVHCCIVEASRHARKKAWESI